MPQWVSIPLICSSLLAILPSFPCEWKQGEKDPPWCDSLAVPKVLKFSIIPKYWSPCQANIVNCETDLENPTTNDLFGEVTSYFSLVLECHSLISTPNNLFKEVAFSAS